MTYSYCSDILAAYSVNSNGKTARLTRKFCIRVGCNHSILKVVSISNTNPEVPGLRGYRKVHSRVNSAPLSCLQNHNVIGTRDAQFHQLVTSVVKALGWGRTAGRGSAADDGCADGTVAGGTVAGTVDGAPDRNV